MDATQEVKARLSIEDVVSEYVQLKRAGRNFKGLSPFTNERTPSFVVSPEKQIWHDFSSGRGGDVYSFIIEVEGVDFKGALELLARKAGVDLDQFKSGHKKSGVDKEQIYQALELATKFYQVQLKGNQKAWQYVAQERAFSKSTLLDFQIGYSPNNGTALVDFLQGKGFSLPVLRTSGLAISRGGRDIDMFRGRIMIPLADGFGRVVGFTARLLLPEDTGPKYINTPSTPLYDKSRHVYGLHLAKKTIRAQGFSVVCEGNLDVIASHQSGTKNVVATAGTAMTEYQLKSLSRLAPEVRLAFDQDQAGLAATERAIPIASKVGLNLQIVTIPEGKDPDELIKKDPALWTQAIDAQKPAFDWLLGRYSKKLDLLTAHGKRAFSEALLPIVNMVTDPVEQDHYLGQISQSIGVDAKILRDKMGAKSAQPRLKYVKPKQDIPMDPNKKEWNKTVDRLLCLALMMPGTRWYLDMIEIPMIPSEEAKQLLVFLKDNRDFDGDIKGVTAMGKVQGLKDYVKILSLQFEELYSTVDTLELQFEAARLRAKTIEYFVKNEKKRIASQLEDATNDAEKKLLEQSRDLDKLLKKAKE